MKEKKEKKLDKNAKKEQKNKKSTSNKIAIRYDKEKLGAKFIDVIKKRWLISGTNTILLIAILIALVILINSFVQSLNLTPIDCTSNKEYTLTDESKQRISNIQSDINIYFIGYEESDARVSLAKQYNKANNKINVEVIDANERTDLASKYDITNNSTAIIVENGEKSKVLYSDDLYTYDSDYQTIDITEEKITSAILNVTSEKIANVYFLEGYSSYSLDYSGGMYYLSTYLKNEVLNYQTLNLLVSGSIPEDCDTLVITTPTTDFDDLTVTEITNYINKGGNILWLNSSYATSRDLPNVNKILALYGINPFEVGYVYEKNDKRTALGYASCIIEDLGSTEIASKLTETILFNPTKINVNENELDNLGVVKQPLIETSDTSYFRRNISNTSDSTEGDEQGGFLLGGIFTKKISTSTEDDFDDTDDNDAVKSKLVIIGDNNFVSDLQITSQVRPMLLLGNNKDLMLNSVAYLTENTQDITIRRAYTQISDFTPTTAQKVTIVRIIFIVPIAIILFGFIVWRERMRKK